MIPKKGTLPNRYLPNDEHKFKNWMLQTLVELNHIGHTEIRNCLEEHESKTGVLHLTLTPNVGDSQNITVHTKMLAFKLDYYNVAIQPNCCLNQIDIFVQYTFLP